MGQPQILIVGVGGLGCPAARALAESGVGLRLVDDDVVDISNLHRQILFSEAHTGRPKAEVAADELRKLGGEAEPVLERFVPENAAALLEGIELVLDGSDNLPTKFLVSDAAERHSVHAVHAGAVRWGGWALASARSEASHSACLRCLFEELPAEPMETCEFAGVVGPAVGALGAIQALLALRLLAGQKVGGTLIHLDGLKPSLRQTQIHARPDCPHALGLPNTLERSRYSHDH